MFCFHRALRYAVRVDQTRLARFLSIQHLPLVDGAGVPEVSAVHCGVVAPLAVLVEFTILGCLIPI